MAASNESGLREPSSQFAAGSRVPALTVQPEVSALAWRGSAKDTLAMEARGNAESLEKTSKRQMLGTLFFDYFSDCILCCWQSSEQVIHIYIL